MMDHGKLVYLVRLNPPLHLPSSFYCVVPASLKANSSTIVDGEGVMSDPEGTKYLGQFKTGYKHGQVPKKNVVDKRYPYLFFF